MSPQSSVEPVIKYLKGITKKDQGRFVVVTDTNMHYCYLKHELVTCAASIHTLR